MKNTERPKRLPSSVFWFERLCSWSLMVVIAIVLFRDYVRQIDVPWGIYLLVLVPLSVLFFFEVVVMVRAWLRKNEVT